MAAILTVFLINIYMDMPCVFPYPSAPLNLKVLFEAIDNVPLDGCVVPPSLIEDLSHSAESVPRLKKLKWLWFGGG